MNVLRSIGNTPIVKIKNILNETKADIFIKLEKFNSGGSIKSRVGFVDDIIPLTL